MVDVEHWVRVSYMLGGTSVVSGKRPHVSHPHLVRLESQRRVHPFVPDFPPDHSLPTQADAEPEELKGMIPDLSWKQLTSRRLAAVRFRLAAHNYHWHHRAGGGLLGGLASKFLAWW